MSRTPAIEAARATQLALRTQVIRELRLPVIRRVAGVDVGVDRLGGRVRAAVAVFDFPALCLRESSVAVRRLEFPYVPGYLSFRELPAILDALDNLGGAPDLLLCDGHGLAHPRRFGLACHLGVSTGIATIGVAKSRLVGSHDPVPEQRGAWVELLDRDRTGEQAGDRGKALETIGAVVRSRARVRPIYVSIGHRVSLPGAVDLVMRCVTRYRLPETTRAADRLAARR